MTRSPAGQTSASGNEESDPSSLWWGQVRSGISITNISDDSSEVTFLWQPRWVPQLTFKRPPGNELSPNFRIKYTAFDFWGGTRLQFYYDDDKSGYDGVLLGERVKNTDRPGRAVL